MNLWITIRAHALAKSWSTKKSTSKAKGLRNAVRKMSSLDPFWFPQFHTFPHHWTVSLAKHSPMTFTNVLENLVTVWNVNQAVGLHNDAEGV